MQLYEPNGYLKEMYSDTSFFFAGFVIIKFYMFKYNDLIMLLSILCMKRVSWVRTAQIQDTKCRGKL